MLSSCLGEKNPNGLLTICVAMIVVVCLSFTSSCTNTRQAIPQGYVRVNVTKSGVNFSFLYPESYIDFSNTLDKSSENVNQISLDHPEQPGSLVSDSLFGLEISDLGDHYTNALEELSRSLEVARDYNGLDTKFVLIERSSSEIGPLIIQKAVYSAIFYFEQRWRPARASEAFFDYKDKGWHLRLVATQNRAEEAMVEFDTIITSIEIQN